MFALGLPTMDGKHGSIAHSAANDAAFEMQMFLAILNIPDHKMDEAVAKAMTMATAPRDTEQ